MSRRRPVATLLCGCAAVWSTAILPAQEDDDFPNTTERGRAAIEYQDDDIHAVAAYYYSQRSHDSAWLLVEVAVSTTRTLVFDRENIRLVTPEGGEVRLAEQRRFAEDSRRTETLVRNASPSRHVRPPCGGAPALAYSW